MKRIVSLIPLLTLSTAPLLQAQLVVTAPGMELRQDQKNIFDTLKYTWEQAQWAEKLTTLHHTLTTVQDHLATANQVKQAIGDPASVIGKIDNGIFSGYLEDSGIVDTLGELTNIAREGGEISATIGQLFEPIHVQSWQGSATDTSHSFDGIASFRDRDDPLKRFRAVENAYSRFESLLGRAHNKRKELNRQVARLNQQLKGAENDAEVQKLVGSIATAQAALDDIDYLTESTASQVRMLHVLNQNRTQAEEVAAEEISRERNRELARRAAEAEASIDASGLSLPNRDLPPGF